MAGCRGFFFVTGPPASGKSTLMSKLVDHAMDMGVTVQGFFTPELRQGFRRLGFDIQVINGPRVALARREPLGDPSLRFASYYLNPRASRVFTQLLPKEPPEGGILVLDELGPMELYVPGGREYFRRVLSRAQGRIAGVVHRRLGKYDPRLHAMVKHRSRLVDLSSVSWGRAWEDALAWLEECALRE